MVQGIKIKHSCACAVQIDINVMNNTIELPERLQRAFFPRIIRNTKDIPHSLFKENNAIYSLTVYIFIR